MKVILMQDIPGTGRKDQIVSVSDGYARNYLFPRGWAREASDSSVREIERKNESGRRQEFERRQAAESLAAALNGKIIALKAKCGEKGRLYGSVTGQEIADALLSQHGVTVDKRKIELAEPIRTVGETEATVWLHPGLSARMKVLVTALEQPGHPRHG